MLPPQGERYSPVGLDIGSSRLKALQLKWVRGTTYLYRAASADMPGSAMQGGRISDQKAVTSLVREMREYQGWRRRRVNICIDPQACYTCRFTLPNLRAGEEKRTIARTVREMFPFLGPEAIYDYCIVQRVHPEQSMVKQYLLTAAEPAVISAYTKAISAAGCYPGLLEVRPISQLRSLVLRFPRNLADDYCLALLDIGFSGSTLLVAAGQTLPYWRSLKTGIKHFCRPFFSAGRMGFQEACRALFSACGSGLEKITGVSALLTCEVKRTLNYLLESGYGASRKPDLLVLCGGGSSVPGLPRLLQNQLGLMVQVDNPLPGSQPSGPGVKGSPIFTAAHGLALKGWLE